MRIEQRRIDVGHRELAAELYVPDGAGPWPGVLLLHELFGLTSQVRADARDLCRHGYLVLAPDLYTGGMARFCIKLLFSADALANRSTVPATREVARCLDFLKAQPQCSGRLGMIGMCLSGGFVLQMARRDDMVAPVVYHHGLGVRGGGLPETDAADIDHTVLGHFAAVDRYCPRSKVEALQRQLGDRLEAHVYDGVGHGLRSVFRHTPQSAESWRRTLEFFRTHL